MKPDKDKPFDTFVMIERLNKAVEALKYIEAGVGAYNRDNHQHAKNTITNMKDTAKEVLDDLGIDRTGYDPYSYEGGTNK